jgi:hypothetical protein
MQIKTEKLSPIKLVKIQHFSNTLLMRLWHKSTWEVEAGGWRVESQPRLKKNNWRWIEKKRKEVAWTQKHLCVLPIVERRESFTFYFKHLLSFYNDLVLFLKHK